MNPTIQAERRAAIDPERSGFRSDGGRLSAFAIPEIDCLRLPRNVHMAKGFPSTRGARFSSDNGKQQKLSFDQSHPGTTEKKLLSTNNLAAASST